MGMEKKGQCLSDLTVIGTLKFGGGSLMARGLYNVPTYLVKINRKMDAELYCQILS